MFTMLHIYISMLASRLRSEKGEVSLEYALVGGLMAVAIVLGIASLTTGLGTWFSGISARITAAVPGP